MSDNTLLTNERQFLKFRSKKEIGSNVSGDLALTSKRVIFSWTSGGLFSREENKLELPVNQLKINDGELAMDLKYSEDKCCYVLNMKFLTNELAFSIPEERKNDVVEWMDAICMEILGRKANLPTRIRNAMVGAGEFFEAANQIKGAVSAFKDSLGLPTKQKSNKVTVRCTGCMAAVTGEKGETVRCKYCDTMNNL